MATLYVTEPGVQVHKQGQRLLIKRGQDILQDIPLIKIDRLILMGRGVNVTTPALYALTRQKIDIVYLNSHGGYEGRTIGPEHKHSQLRHRQGLAVADPARIFPIAQAIVRGKVHNQRVLVQRHAEGASWAGSALALMDSMKKQVDTSHNLDELRGREGLAAREYFRLLRQLLRPPADGKSWGFEQRAYYPPPDPINALLSFGYTLLLNDLITACQLAGLDPYLGSFHAIDYGKPAMALDLEEEFRPIIVDSIVLTVTNRSIFHLQDFEIGNAREKPPQQDRAERPVPPRPIFMKEEARKRFVTFYETRLNEQIFYPPLSEQTTYRRILELQAYQMAQVILGQAGHYVPFTVR